MKILVTGGAGFIGSALIRYIIKETDNSVINVDKLTYAGNLENLKEIHSSKRYFFEKVDICDYDSIFSIFLKYEPDIVMHLAAESHVDRSIQGPSDFIETNIFGTYNLLEASRKYSPIFYEKTGKSFLFHHVSTDEVYGDLPHPDDNSSAMTKLFTEKSHYAPSSPYSASKASSDHLVRAWSRTYGLRTVITNCSNNYGPYQMPDKLIPLCIKKVFKSEPIPVYGSGQQIRDWLYVDDHAAALYLIATSDLANETFNIGGHNELRNIEVIQAICNIMQEVLSPKSDIKNFEELITFVDDRPGHDLRYAIDSEKIRKKFGWQPKETFDSGLKKTILWYLDKLKQDELYFDKI